MTRYAAILTTVVPLALAACSPEADAPADQASGSPAAETLAAQTPAAPATSTVAIEYATLAGAGDLFEIESSRLALSRSASDEVKAFAQMMIEQHTQSTQDLAAAAEAAGLTPVPASMNPMQQDMLDQLEGLSGAEFDAAYLGQQAEAHRMALDLHRTYAAGGDTAQLREAAGKIASAVEQHITELQQIGTP